MISRTRSTGRPTGRSRSAARRCRSRPAVEIPLAEQGPRLLEQHGWDAVAYLTDLPRRYHGQPIVEELVSAAGIILVSLPALGAHRVAARTRALLVPLLTSLAGATDE